MNVMINKKFWLFCFIANALLFPFSGKAGNSTKNQDSSQESYFARIKMTFNHQEVIVVLFDSPASQALLAQLPLTLSFSDFASTEKIAYLPKKLPTQNTPSAKQVSGDFTYYGPWGNLALFYQGYGDTNGLYVLGKIESGKPQLAAMTRNFTAIVESIE